MLKANWDLFAKKDKAYIKCWMYPSKFQLMGIILGISILLLLISP